MGRIRTIKPEFPQSESMGNVSRDARLCFILLWTQSDDEGRLRGSSRMLASLLFPYDSDAPSLIDGWLTELEREKCLTRYEVDGRHYIYITNWLQEQKIDHPSRSKLPSLAKPREDSCDGRESERGIKDQGSRKILSVVPVLTVVTKQETVEELTSPSPKPRKRSSEAKKKARKKKQASPPTKTEQEDARHTEFKVVIFEYFKSKNNGKDPPWDGSEGKQLGMWLKANPKITLPEFKTMLRHRYRSDVTHGDRPAVWIWNINSFANGPLDRYSKPLVANGTGGKPNGRSTAESRESEMLATANAALAANVPGMDSQRADDHRTPDRGSGNSDASGADDKRTHQH